MIWFFRNQSGRSSKSMIAFVRRCHRDGHCHFQRWFYSFMQVIFVWLVICSHSSSSIRIDDTLILGRSTELHIHVFGDAGHVFASCSYLCRKAYQPLFWLVCGLFTLKSMLDIYHGLVNIHLGLRGYVAFHYIFRISELNIFFFLGSRNTRSV